MRQAHLGGRTKGLRPGQQRQLDRLSQRRHPEDNGADLLTLERLAKLVDELRRRADSAERAASDATRRAEAAEASERACAARAEAAENLASSVEAAASKALARADAAEAETRERDARLTKVLAAQDDVSDRDMAEVALSLIHI